MLSKEKIIELLNTLPEHKMAKEIFVSVLKRKGIKGVKFTGGPDEVGIDIEYYELTEPEKHKSYVGIQFKKGNLSYSGGGGKGSVKEVKNQAEEAFGKEIYDVDDRGKQYISRFIVATTGNINEKARMYIGRVREKGVDRRIDYWTGDRLAEFIQDCWMKEFIEYFKVDERQSDKEAVIVDAEYIEENYETLVTKCRNLKNTINNIEWNVVMAIYTLAVNNINHRVPMSDLLMELGHTEEYYEEHFRHLMSLDFIDIDESGICLTSHASIMHKLDQHIADELTDAEETETDPKDILNELIN